MKTATRTLGDLEHESIPSSAAGEGDGDDPVPCCTIWDPCCASTQSTGTETLLEPESMVAESLFAAGAQSAECCPGSGGGGGDGGPQDCNDNDAIDICDIRCGDSVDCLNGNWVPDECEASPDCQPNSKNDYIDLADGRRLAGIEPDSLRLAHRIQQGPTAL